MRRPWALPLVPLYAAGSALRWAVRDWTGVKPQRLAWPVLSVGSLSAGGAGKTPFVIALAKLLTEKGWRVDVLSRGYGRMNAGVARVDAGGSAEQFGDEPLLIACEAGVPVFVGARRWEAGQLAETQRIATGHDVHLLDDGFQHRRLHRDLDIVLVSTRDLEDWLLPAGNRREPLSALRRASAFAVADEDEAERQLREMGLGPEIGQPIWRYRRELVVPEISGPVLAFCGIARPEQFFEGLEQAGVEITARRSFPDHHRFTDADLAALQEMVRKSGATAMVTTAKDAVRMGDRVKLLGMPVEVADLQVQLVDEAGVMQWLAHRLR